MVSDSKNSDKNPIVTIPPLEFSTKEPCGYLWTLILKFVFSGKMRNFAA